MTTSAQTAASTFALIFPVQLGLAKKVTWQSLPFIKELRNSGQFSNFVPSMLYLRQYRIQEQLVFTF